MDGIAAVNYVIATLQGAQQNGGGTNFQFNNKALLRASTPSGLPQLHTSVVQPGSPHHPGTPLASDGQGSQSAGEPAMPTLSPHPPSIKEEVVEATPSTAESQDQGGGGTAAVESPAAAGTPAAAEANKDKAATDQVLIDFF